MDIVCVIWKRRLQRTARDVLLKQDVKKERDACVLC